MRFLTLFATATLLSSAAMAGMTNNYAPSIQQKRQNDSQLQQLGEMQGQTKKLEDIQAQQQQQLQALQALQAQQSQQIAQQQQIISLLQSQIKLQQQAIEDARHVPQYRGRSTQSPY